MDEMLSKFTKISMFDSSNTFSLEGYSKFFDDMCMCVSYSFYPQSDNPRLWEVEKHFLHELMYILSLLLFTRYGTIVHDRPLNEPEGSSNKQRHKEHIHFIHILAHSFIRTFIHTLAECSFIPLMNSFGSFQ